MNVLKEEPFWLKVGDPINVKSQAKVDKWGPNEISTNIDVKLITQPNITRASITDQGSGQVVVSWDADDTGYEDNFELLQGGVKIGDLTQNQNG
jgi:hypothetical protein